MRFFFYSKAIAMHACELRSEWVSELNSGTGWNAADIFQVIEIFFGTNFNETQVHFISFSMLSLLLLLLLLLYTNVMIIIFFCPLATNARVMIMMRFIFFLFFVTYSYSFFSFKPFRSYVYSRLSYAL